METKVDWKDVASGFYDKCLSLTILFVIFSFLVFPDIEQQEFRSVERILETIEIPPEIQERIEPPPDMVRPIVNIEIVDVDTDDPDDDVQTIETIDITTMNPFDVMVQPTGHGETPRFVIWEDAPVVTRRVAPQYPDFERRLRIQGVVILTVEVLIDGSIGAIEVERSVTEGLDDAAIAAVRQWQFQPAKNRGEPVACWISQQIHFVLDN
ncbi:MAG: energy transducer TonB [Candidatus Cloacimonetes bacterium]|nr:energy transducer TonB [Candidatus Cloacimonadota bacterium]